MSVKIKINGIDIECEAADLPAVMAAMQGQTTPTKPIDPKAAKAAKREAFLAEAVDLTEAEKAKAREIFESRATPKGFNPFGFQKAAKSGKATPAIKAYLLTV
jgi:hypothetical protein